MTFTLDTLNLNSSHYEIKSLTVVPGKCGRTESI